VSRRAQVRYAMADLERDVPIAAETVLETGPVTKQSIRFGWQRMEEVPQVPIGPCSTRAGQFQGRTGRCLRFVITLTAAAAVALQSHSRLRSA